jgi:hypothetical protein
VANQFGSFTVNSQASPTPSLSLSGTLPAERRPTPRPGPMR